jgi:hypothetical protein
MPWSEAARLAALAARRHKMRPELQEVADLIHDAGGVTNIETAMTAGAFLSDAIQQDPETSAARTNLLDTIKKIETANPSQRQALTPLLKRLHQDYYKARRRSTIVALREFRDVNTEKIDWAPGADRATVQTMEAALSMLPSDWIKESNEFGTEFKRLKAVPAPARQRSYIGQYQPDTGTINLANADTATAVHEFAHRLEDAHGNNLASPATGRQIVGLEREFWDSRRSAPYLQQLKGYGRDVVGDPDHFVRSYMGRIYQRSGHFEILSTGLEDALFGKYNMDFSDPDFYHFTLGLLFGS